MRLIPANQIEIAVEMTGRGPPILLLHGAEGDHSMFAPLGAALASHLTVIAYDQRDCGATLNGEDAYGLDDLADDAAALAPALGFDRVHVFGQSLGGVIAQALAARHPARVERLILSSTFRLGAHPLDIEGSAIAAMIQARAGLPGTARQLAGFFFPSNYLDTHPETTERFRPSERTPAQQARRGGLLLGPTGAMLSQVTAPTLVLGGSEDALSPPSHAAAIAHAISGASLAILDGIGHVGAIQAPQRLAATVLEFLQSRKE